MRWVADYCSGRVLDIGCGLDDIFINRFIGNNSGVGIGVFHYPDVDKIVEDMARLPFDDASFDTVTLVAVNGHIPEEGRAVEFNEFRRVLKPVGRSVGGDGG